VAKPRWEEIGEMAAFFPIRLISPLLF